MFTATKIRSPLKSVPNYSIGVNNTIFIPLPSHLKLWVKKKNK